MLSCWYFLRSFQSVKFSYVQHGEYLFKKFESHIKTSTKKAIFDSLCGLNLHIFRCHFDVLNIE